MNFDCAPPVENNAVKADISADFYQEQVKRFERREKMYIITVIFLVIMILLSAGLSFYSLAKAKATATYIQHIESVSGAENVGIYDGIKVGGEN